MFQVKNMSTEDITFAVHITDEMSWELTEEDFKFMMQLEPKGCFVLLHDSEKVGIVTTVSFGKAAWLGNLIVSERYRKSGGGSLLVRHVVNYSAGKNVETVGLYSYTDKVPFYRRLGFKYDSDFTVLRGRAFSSPTRASLRAAKKADMEEVMEFDHFYFGASRRKLLGPILHNPHNLCYVSVEDGRMSGYAIAKVYESTAELGPLVCLRERSDTATDLLKAVLSKMEGLEVSTCIPRREATLLDVLKSFGFDESFHVVRMFFGPPFIRDCIYVAESLERG